MSFRYVWFLSGLFVGGYVAAKFSPPAFCFTQQHTLGDYDDDMVESAYIRMHIIYIQCIVVFTSVESWILSQSFR